MKKYGLDLSEHNGGLDFQAIKNACNDFVILRCGYGSASSQKDKRFEEYYRQAKAVGLHVSPVTNLSRNTPKTINNRIVPFLTNPTDPVSLFHSFVI